MEFKIEKIKLYFIGIFFRKSIVTDGKQNVYIVSSASFLLCILTLLILFSGCEKQLEAKPDLQLVSPTSIADMQAILDYTPNMVFAMGAGEASADNYWIPQETFNSFDEPDRRLYTWQKDNFFTGSFSEWGRAYRKIYYCNTVLDASPLAASYLNVRAQALFHRAQLFYELAQIFAMPYDVSTANGIPGIPLRLNSDFNEVSVRPSLSDCYTRVLADLKTAVMDLPVTVISPVRPSKAAAYGMLSRVYLGMRDYTNAKVFADSALFLYHTLQDYQLIDPSADFSFERWNAETISYSSNGGILNDAYYTRVDSTLYGQYQSGDLRKSLFFFDGGDGTVGFKGSYSAFDGQFKGIAVDELLLNRAECFARAGQTAEAMEDINSLLAKRFDATFIPRVATDAAVALRIILEERRKELLFRGLRWTDLRRFNLDGAGIGLRRLIDGKTFQLGANDQRYALPIPEDVITISGMMQNPR